MPAFKWTYRIKYISGDGTTAALNRAGSFTESVYWSEASAGARRGFTALAQARAAFLPNFTAVTGIRVQQVDPSGPGQLQKVFFPGLVGADAAQDIPQMAYLWSFPTSLTNVRKFITPALPDGWVFRGEPNLDAFKRTILAGWLNQLNGWLSRGEDLTRPKIPIKTIAANGTYELTADLVMAPLSTVKVYSVQDASENSITGQFTVESVTDSKHGVLRGWTGGVCTLGSMRLINIVYPVINTRGFDLASVTATTRKIGRPFEKYVGQRRKKRRKSRTA